MRRSVVKHVVLSVAQAFEQVAAGLLLAAGDAGDLGQADQDAVLERVDQGRGDVAGVAGRPWARAVFAACVSPCRASRIWAGQCEPG